MIRWKYQYYHGAENIHKLNIIFPFIRLNHNNILIANDLFTIRSQRNK